MIKDNEKQKVLILTQFYIPDITAAAYRINDMYESMKDMFETDIVTTYPHKSNAVVESGENNIYRVDISSKSKNRVVKYLNEYFGFMLKSVFLAKELKKRYDFVFVTSPPIFVLISGYILSKLKKSKLIIDIRDIWPDVLLDDGTLSKNNFVFKMLKQLEGFMYKRADNITCVSKYMAEYIEQKSGKSVSIIYNGISNDTFIENKSIRNPYPDKKLNLFYTGNLGFFQHMDVLLEVFNDDIIQEKFSATIIGGGAQALKISNYIKERNLTYSINLIQPMEKKLMNKKIADEADVLFFNLYDSATLRRTIPSKLFDYLGFNLPLVYGIKGEGKELLDHLSCGTSFEWDSAHSLKEALLEIYDRYAQYQQKSQCNSDYVCRNFDRKKIFGRFWEEIGEGELC